MWNKNIQALADKEENKGILPSIMFPSPVMYFDNDNCGLCADCANRQKDAFLFEVTDFQQLSNEDCEYAYCEDCGKYIDPALNVETQERE